MRPYKRSFKNYFIDRPFQTKYLLLTILLLSTYTFIFIIILFLPSIFSLYLDSTLENKAEAARIFLVLHNTIWPTTAVVIIIFGILSIFLTHKISGPVYRVKRALAELIGGNLDSRINLRKGDDLQELAEQVNFFSDELRSFVNSLKNDHEQLSNYIDELEKEIHAKSLSTEEDRNIIGQVQDRNKAIALTLERFTTKP